MKLFVGLGNPGGKYAANRHNIGFMALDAIAGAHSFGPWRKKFQAEIAEGTLGGEKVTLVKPQTYMNLSGQSVGEAMRYLKLSPADVWVFHDELDLAPGKLRVKTGGGHAGHNGLRSMHAHVGADYHRVRMGIGHPGDKNVVANYVLQDFAKADRDWLDPLLDAVGRNAAKLAAGDAAGFMNAVALALRPPEPARPRPADRTAAKPSPESDGTGVPPEAPAGTPNTDNPLHKLLARFGRK